MVCYTLDSTTKSHYLASGLRSQSDVITCNKVTRLLSPSVESHRHKHTLVDGRNDLGSFEKVLQLPNTEVSHTNRLHQTLCYYGLHSLGGGVVQGTQEGGTAVILVTQ